MKTTNPPTIPVVSESTTRLATPSHQVRTPADQVRTPADQVRTPADQIHALCEWIGELRAAGTGIVADVTATDGRRLHIDLTQPCGLIDVYDVGVRQFRISGKIRPKDLEKELLKFCQGARQ